MRAPLVALLSAALFFGCPSPRDEGLIVNLQTDLHAGVEFDTVAIEVNGETRRTVAVGLEDAFAHPRFVTNYAALAPGERTIRVVLLDGVRERAARTLRIAFGGSYLVTAVITRTCVDFPCSPGLACAGARCVPEDCVTGEEATCPMATCTRDSDCTTLTGCASALCTGGLCLEAPDDTRCAASEVCVVGSGCIARPGTLDAHVGLDAAGADAGPAIPDARVCATETCDGRDDDCDGLVDEAACTVMGTACSAIQGAGRVYQYCATRLNQMRVQSACAAMGYTMLDIADAAEQDLVFPAVMAGGSIAWIGLNDIAEEGVYRWSTGELATYTNWDVGARQPDNAGGVQDCVEMSPSTGLWSDLACSNPYPFVCERAVLP